MFRVQPTLPVQAVKTYAALAPRATHFRPGKCEEVDCANWRHGWRTAVDESSELGQAQAHYIRREAGRFYVEAREGPLTVFLFEPGQQCFAAHQVPLERPPLFLVRGGDWREHLGLIRQHTTADEWVDDFANHQQQLAERVERG